MIEIGFNKCTLSIKQGWHQLNRKQIATVLLGTSDCLRVNQCSGYLSQWFRCKHARTRNVLKLINMKILFRHGYPDCSEIVLWAWLLTFYYINFIAYDLTSILSHRLHPLKYKFFALFTNNTSYSLLLYSVDLFINLNSRHLETVKFLIDQSHFRTWSQQNLHT